MGIAREVGHDLLTVQPGRGRGQIALNAGFAIATPAVLLTLLGQPEAGLVATSGGFLAWYLPTRSRRERMRWLPLIGTALIAASALGVVSEGMSNAAAVAALCVVTCVAAWVGFALRFGPPGALFFLLITGASSHLVAPVRAGGAGIDGRFVIAMTGLGMLIAYCVVLTPLLVPRVNRADRELWQRRERVTWGLEPESRLILARIMVAAVVAALASLPLDVHRAYWIDLTLVVILQNGIRVRLTFERAVLRIAGTFVGLGIFAGFATLHLQGVALGLVLGALQGVSEWVVTKNYGLALLTITPMALLFATQGGAVDVGADVVTRLVDTVLGTAIALAVLFASWWVVLRSPRFARWSGVAGVEQRPSS